MDIQIDSRENEHAIERIIAEFDRQNVVYDVSKLIVGDYMSFDNPRLIIDRKKDLSEVCGNLCYNEKYNPRDKDGKLRIDREMERAARLGIKLIFLVEHGRGIKCMEDVKQWENPQLRKTPYAWDGDTLHHRMLLFSEKYNVPFLFCEKKDTGKRILELLS